MLPLLILGAEGQVARALAARAPGAGWEPTCIGRANADLTTAEIAPLLDQYRPALIVNAAAYTAVDRAEAEETLAFSLNADLPRRIAEACSKANVPLVHISTDYVFDGAKDGPYLEDDPIAPLGVYGRTKAAGEAAIEASGANAAVLRTAWVYGREGSNFLLTMLRLGLTHDELAVVADQIGCPTWSHEVAQSCLSLGGLLQVGEQSARGVFHAAGEGETSWAGFADAIFEERVKEGAARVRVRPISTDQYPTTARRPANSRLDCQKLLAVTGWRPRPWRLALRDVMKGLAYR